MLERLRRGETGQKSPNTGGKEWGSPQARKFGEEGGENREKKRREDAKFREYQSSSREE